jgi:hypothetical protein
LVQNDLAKLAISYVERGGDVRRFVVMRGLFPIRKVVAVYLKRIRHGCELFSIRSMDIRVKVILLDLIRTLE